MKVIPVQMIENTKSVILQKHPKAFNFRVGHNTYCYGIFWDGTLEGLGNYEFEPLVVEDGGRIMASENDIDLS